MSKCAVCSDEGKMRLRSRDGVTNEWNVIERPCGACRPLDGKGLAMITVYPGKQTDSEIVEAIAPFMEKP